jgi:ABC-2 type transport system permease protein
MSGFATIYRRELAGLFLSPLAWVLLCLAVAFNGFWFLYCMEGTGGDLRASMFLTLGGAWPAWVLLALLPPILTMRMVSEEARSGLLEFLLTAPVSDAAVVLGKLAAATTLMACLWSTVLGYGLVAQALGTAPDWAPALSSVVGATLVSALFCAIGLVASASTSTPLLSAFLGVTLDLAVLMLPMLETLLALPRKHGLKLALGHVNLLGQFQASFGIGVLDSKHVLTFLAWTALFALIATRLLESRRWR